MSCGQYSKSWWIHRISKMASKIEHIEFTTGSHDWLRSAPRLHRPPPQRVNPQWSDSWHTDQGRDLLSQRNNPTIWFQLSWYPSLISFAKSMSELNPCCISASPKHLSSEKNAVTVEEKIINEKGKSHLPCVKSHSNFWKGSGTASKFPWGPWNRDEVLVPVKNSLPLSDGDIFSNQTSEPMGLTVGIEYLKLELFWTTRTFDSQRMALPYEAIRALPPWAVYWEIQLLYFSKLFRT